MPIHKKGSAGFGSSRRAMRGAGGGPERAAVSMADTSVDECARTGVGLYWVPIGVSGLIATAASFAASSGSASAPAPSGASGAKRSRHFWMSSTTRVECARCRASSRASLARPRRSTPVGSERELPRMKTNEARKVLMFCSERSRASMTLSTSR